MNCRARRLVERLPLVCAGLTLGLPAHAQTLGTADDGGVSAWRVIGALLFCLLLAVGGAYALRKRLGPHVVTRTSGARRLELLESVRLNHQVSVSLLRLDDREFLVTTSPQGGRMMTVPTNLPA